jgi:hypothetical protein
MREEHRLLLAQHQKISSDRNDQSQSEVRRMIAKRRTARESPERSSSLLVVVVCTEALGMPIQLWKDFVVKTTALDPALPTA